MAEQRRLHVGSFGLSSSSWRGSSRESSSSPPASVDVVTLLPSSAAGTTPAAYAGSCHSCSDVGSWQSISRRAGASEYAPRCGNGSILSGAPRSKSLSRSAQSCVSMPAEISSGPPPSPPMPAADPRGSPTPSARTSCVCGRRLQLSSQRRGGAGRKASGLDA